MRGGRRPPRAQGGVGVGAARLHHGLLPGGSALGGRWKGAGAKARARGWAGVNGVQDVVLLLRPAERTTHTRHRRAYAHGERPARTGRRRQHRRVAARRDFRSTIEGAPVGPHLSSPHSSWRSFWSSVLVFFASKHPATGIVLDPAISSNLLRLLLWWLVDCSIMIPATVSFAVEASGNLPSCHTIAKFRCFAVAK